MRQRASFFASPFMEETLASGCQRKTFAFGASMNRPFSFFRSPGNCWSFSSGAAASLSLTVLPRRASAVCRFFFVPSRNFSLLAIHSDWEVDRPERINFNDSGNKGRVMTLHPRQGALWIRKAQEIFLFVQLALFWPAFYGFADFDAAPTPLGFQEKLTSAFS